MEIGNLVNLDRIALDNNSFTGEIPSTLFNNTGIRGISLLGNFFTGSLPENIGISLPNLGELYLGINNLSGVIPDSISNASKLFRLGLGYNEFTGHFPRSFGGLRLLQYLNVIENNLTPEPSSSSSSSMELSFFDSLTNCRQLRQLWIGYNPLNGTLPVSMGNLSATLEYVYAAYSGIRGPIPDEIANLSSLSFLFLQGNELTGSIPTTLGRLRKLQALNLYDNNMMGPIPNEICNLKDLGFLSLGLNEFCCSVPGCLGDIKSLRYIYLNENKMNSSIPSSLWNLTDLLHFDLSSNFLTGSLPVEIGTLKTATLFNISKNQISGIIPSTIGGMGDMIELYLAFNRFEGSIPESFGSMIALESLDLSQNNLSGEIPKSLEALSHLEYFNVSFNRLAGPIPTKGPFANFSYESFISNDALCGSSNMRVPACTASSPRKKLLLPLLISLAAAFLVLAAVILLVIQLKSRKKNNTNNIVTENQSSEYPLVHGRISYYELEQATSGFSEEKLLGKGGYGSVYKAFLGGIQVAVKVFNLQMERGLTSFNTECEVLRNLRHRNLTKVISSCSKPDFKALVLEYMPNGSLENWLCSNQYSFLNLLQRLDIMIDVASALDYLHNGYFTPVVHCDLKPSNVLLDEDMVAHVSDFGIAKLLGMDKNMTQTQTFATIGYMAPGEIMTQNYSSKRKIEALK